MELIADYTLYRARLKGFGQVWWSLFLQLLITSAWTCLEHSRNLAEAFLPSSVELSVTGFLDVHVQINEILFLSVVSSHNLRNLFHFYLGDISKEWGDAAARKMEFLPTSWTSGFDIIKIFFWNITLGLIIFHPATRNCAANSGKGNVLVVSFHPGLT